jgi:hypothetical protein
LAAYATPLFRRRKKGSAAWRRVASMSTNVRQRTCRSRVPSSPRRSVPSDPIIPPVTSAPRRGKVVGVGLRWECQLPMSAEAMAAAAAKAYLPPPIAVARIFVDLVDVRIIPASPRARESIDGKTGRDEKSPANGAWTGRALGLGGWGLCPVQMLNTRDGP